MSKAKVASIALWAVVLALGAASALGQVSTGTPPFGSFGGGPDVVNLGNLNAHLAVPVRNKAGRGLRFFYTLSYDSSVWYPTTVNGVLTWQPVANYGWRGWTEAATGYVTAKRHTVSCPNPNYPPDPPETLRGLYFDTFAYHDTFGSSHPFDITVENDGCATDGVVSGVATDGSGITLATDGVSVYTVTLRSGQVINPPYGVGTGAATKADTNGNYVSVSSSGAFTDTLGKTALTVAGSSPVTFTYTAPSGGNASFTMKYTTYTVQTAFGCSGASEYGPTSISLVSEIDLPDGTKYTFSYEPTPGNPANVTGRLASVALPTGGTISYSYSGGNNGIECSDGSAAGLTRTTPDGTWTYARSQGSGSAWTTTVTDPQSNQTVLQFEESGNNFYETERQVYQGSGGSGTLLGTTTICYNGTTTNCPGTGITLPISQRTVFLQWPGGLEAETNALYNGYGLVTEVDQYGYGSGAPGALGRKTLITYASLGNGIVNRPARITVENAAGTVVAQTSYGYDQTAVQATSGTPQHNSVSGSRGNPTTISYLVQGSTTLSRTLSYYDTGNVYQATDVNAATTTFNYGACGNSFPTTISLPLGLSRSLAWDASCSGGVVVSATDPNGQTRSYTYNDPYFWRINAATDPESNTTNYSYTGATAAESSLSFNGGGSTADIRATLDALGRPHLTQRLQAPGSGTYDSVETDYDAAGRPDRATLPYAGTAGQTNGSAPAATAQYDALGRPTAVADAGGGSVGYSYNQNDVLMTLGPAPAGENTKRRQLEYDALGQLASVCELTGLSGSGTCAEASAQTGYWTEYGYNALGELTSVVQNAQAGSSYQQTRGYAYDGLGRMVSETEAESGTTAYVYDSDSTCGSSNGDLVKRVDAVGNVTCYSYDALHRVTAITYSGPYASNTPNKYFVYDAATVNGVARANAKGRLAEAYTATCSTCAKRTDMGLSYTARGELSDVYESTPHSGGYYHTSASYWANGALGQLSGLSGLPTMTYSPDGEGRPYSVTAGSGQNLVTSTSYNTAGLPTGLNLGSGDSDAFSYDSTTGRMTQYQASINGQAIVGQLTWNANGTLGGRKALPASVPGEFLGADVVIVDPGIAEHALHRRDHFRRPGEIVNGRRSLLQVALEHRLVDESGFALPGAVRAIHRVHRRNELEVRVLLLEPEEVLEERRVFRTVVSEEEENPMRQFRAGRVHENAAEGRDPDPAGEEDGRAGRIVVQSQAAEWPFDFHFGARRHAAEHPLERRVAHARRHQDRFLFGRARDAQASRIALGIGLGGIEEREVDELAGLEPPPCRLLEPERHRSLGHLLPAAQLRAERWRALHCAHRDYLLEVRRLLAPRRFHRARGVGARPGVIGGRAVGGRHGLIEQAQINAQLCPVVRRVQDAPPKNPDALAHDVEKRDALEPPRFVLDRQVRQARLGQLLHALREHRRRLLLGQQFGRGWLGQAEKFREKSPLGEQLVLHDVERGARSGIRAKRQILGGKGPPDVHHLVGLAGVGVEQDLEDGEPGARNFCFGNGRVGIFHRHARTSSG
jgi:YD repeat-containing protein